MYFCFYRKELGPMVGSYEHDKEPSGHIKIRTYLDRLSDY
jgi:hypothetical protein